MTLQEIKDEIIEYGKKKGEKWNFDKGDGKGHFIKCIDNFSLDYMTMIVDYFLKNGNNKRTTKK